MKSIFPLYKPRSLLLKCRFLRIAKRLRFRRENFRRLQHCYELIIIMCVEFAPGSLSVLLRYGLRTQRIAVFDCSTAENGSDQPLLHIATSAFLSISSLRCCSYAFMRRQKLFFEQFLCMRLKPKPNCTSKSAQVCWK